MDQIFSATSRYSGRWRAGRTKTPGSLIALTWLVISPVLWAEPVTRHYDWLTADQVSGSLIVTSRENGGYTADFEFNDRGRGPRLHEIIQIDDRGLLHKLELNGHSYMGAPAEESFGFEAGTATWKSTLEAGQFEFDGPLAAWYSATEGTPLQVALLARALLRQPELRMPLLPSGEATITRLTETQAGATAVTLYAIGGLGLGPQYIWLDNEQELFAVAAGWMGLVPGGKAELLPRLQALQDQAEAARSQKLAALLGEPLPDAWVLNNFTLVDVESGQLRPAMMAIVQDGRIVGLIDNGHGGQGDPMVDSQQTVIDGGGHYLIPGLWDMHTHLSLDDGLLHIAAGVTTVRDLGNDPKRLTEVVTAFESGQAIGPRVYQAGFLDQKSPYSAPTGRLAENLDQALAMVDEFAGMGYPQIKIYSSIDPDWVAPIAARVHNHGMRLSGHIPSYMTAERAVNEGFDEIQHINMLFLNFLAGPEDDTRTPLRFSLVADQAAELDLDSAEVTAFIALLKEKNVVVDPTVAIFDSMFRHRSGQLDPSFAMVADNLPPSVRREMLAGEMDITDENANRYAASAQALLNLIGRLHRAGVPLVAGSDNLAGFTLHRELELYQQAGISAAEVLRVVTLDSARVMGNEFKSGSVQVGKYADFVLLKANPLENISAVRTPVAVFKSNRRYDPSKLYKAVGIRPFD